MRLLGILWKVPNWPRGGWISSKIDLSGIKTHSDHAPASRHVAICFSVFSEASIPFPFPLLPKLSPAQSFLLWTFPTPALLLTPAIAPPSPVSMLAPCLQLLLWFLLPTLKCLSQHINAGIDLIWFFFNLFILWATLVSKWMMKQPCIPRVNSTWSQSTILFIHFWV